jgi:hypothetical protein
MPDRAFDFKKFVWFVMSKKLFDYQTLFWRVIAWSIVLKCRDCDEWYQAIHHYDCRFHPNPPFFPQANLNDGFYPCCRKKALRFDTSIKVKGCF